MTDGKRVLLVEDEPNIIDAVRFILSRDGWHVATHSEGSTAVEAIVDRNPDVLILDVMLPNRSGYDILMDLRAIKAMCDLPVLVLTARGQDKDRAAAFSVGATAFMVKPFSNAALIDAVRALAAGDPVEGSDV